MFLVIHVCVICDWIELTEITENCGEFTSHDSYPSNYGRNIEDTWRITVTPGLVGGTTIDMNPMLLVIRDMLFERHQVSLFGFVVLR